MYHSAERRSEAAQINASLAALKDVVRAKSQSVDLDSVYKKVRIPKEDVCPYTHDSHLCRAS